MYTRPIRMKTYTIHTYYNGLYMGPYMYIYMYTRTIMG